LRTGSDPTTSPPAGLTIKLDDVWVRYRVPHERIPTIKEYTIRLLRRRLTYADFWALKGISLEVKKGEIFGIVGANGAGKSTLLKVVARVLRPTKGRVRVWGSVAPLLELGAGFDHELTGRENVFLNGALLGFSHEHMAERFDRIVEFAGLDEFIDAPLRTYSSGMLARLGFAIATDAEPDILIVDEILAVGDSAFQKLSYDRIQRFHERGATIFLVSHDLKSVRELCHRVLWIHKGEPVALGPARDVLERYQPKHAAATNRRET
jgi:ABC-type polysaccharide/polyol phosphate transport system ATPase subunit